MGCVLDASAAGIAKVRISLAFTGVCGCSFVGKVAGLINPERLLRSRSWRCFLAFKPWDEALKGVSAALLLESSDSNSGRRGVSFAET